MCWAKLTWLNQAAMQGPLNSVKALKKQEEASTHKHAMA